MRYLLSVLISVILLVFCFQISEAKSYKETVKKKIEFAPGGKVLVKNTNGRIEVEGWSKNTVLIEAVKKVKASDQDEAREYLEEIRVQIEQHGDEIRVTTRMPRMSNSFWDWIFGSTVTGAVSYRIRVPYQTHLELRTTNGRIEVQNVNGEIDVKATNGKIKCENVSGQVRAATTNGSVEVSFDQVESRSSMYFRTTNGGITVFLPEGVNCDISATTTNGSISSDFPLEIRGKYNSKKVRGKINDGGPLLEFRTTNGSIQILKK